MSFQLGRKWEVRRTTAEGNHILAVGKRDGYFARVKADAQAAEEERWRVGLDKREESLAKLEAILTLPPYAPPLLKYGGVKGLTKIVMRQRNELIKYKDAMFGTSVWKEMTAHTIPHSLRHLDQFVKGEDDKMLYLKIRYDSP